MPSIANLRNLIGPGKMLVAPGAYDCITARLIEQAGFPAVYMTGAGTSISLGYPDFGLVTMTEMVANAGRLAASINVPLISDSDTGYGNELNMYRTVQEFERAGVAAIHIEDQVFPKKCGHLDDKELVSLEDYLAKIRAAVAARRSHDFLIIARTDSRARAGLDEAVRRCNAALAAGADIAFLEAPQTMSEVEQVPKLVKGPCLLNVVRNGKTPEIDLTAAERMGLRHRHPARPTHVRRDRRLRPAPGRDEKDGETSTDARRCRTRADFRPLRSCGMGRAAIGVSS